MLCIRDELLCRTVMFLFAFVSMKHQQTAEKLLIKALLAL